MQTQEANRRWGAGRREDDLESGRISILAAAVQCYERRGVAATTIEDVARAAQISRRTLYRYFPSRQDLIRGVVELQAGVFLEE
jgi:AcrR family transcriptional regulator